MSHANNFGTLRLALAALVIAAHTPEMLDGDRSRELLTMIFGTISFGELAVDGFFVMSGYLITKSMVQSPSIVNFAVSRVARIVPGFLVAFWVCVLVIAPLVSEPGTVTIGVVTNNFWRSIILSPPVVHGVFIESHYPVLNGAMWTVFWEFLCYIGVGVIGSLGLLTERFRIYIAATVVVILCANGFLTVHPINALGYFLPIALRFSGIFGVGVCFYLFRDIVKFSAREAAKAAIALLIFLPILATAELALAIFGGYILFWFAFSVKQLPSSRLRHDISYGLYLYGWPTGAILVWLFPLGNPWVIGFTTLALAALCGLASWLFVEKWPQLRIRHLINYSRSELAST